MNSNQKRFSVVTSVIVIVAVLLLGVISWLLHDRWNKQTSTTSNPTTIENPSKTEPKNEDVAIKGWGVKVNQPKGETIAISDPLGEDTVSGALGTAYVYIPKYDKNYTCGSNQGETYKAKIVTIQRFSSDSNIESNTKNKPDVVKTVGSYKYGIYKLASDCYDSSTTSTIQLLTQSYLKNITIVSI